MHIVLPIVLAWLALANDPIDQTGDGRIIFENQTSVAADMYVDGVYGCRAGPRFHCTAHASTGAHSVELVFVDGDIVRSPPFTLEPDESFTIPVVERAVPDTDRDPVDMVEFAPNGASGRAAGRSRSGRIVIRDIPHSMWGRDTAS